MDSLRLIDGLARHLGETRVTQVPGAKWVAAHSRTKGYQYQNHPVVTGLPTDVPWASGAQADSPLAKPARQSFALASARWMRARRVLWVLAVVATTVNGFVVGYGAVWFQLFGEQADRGDYLTSAGGYLGAAAVLALAPC